MLRKIRIIAAAFCFVLITLLFLDFTGTIHAWFGWLAKIQFWPALLALNVGVVAGLVILTLLLGRVYCSVICPLGVLQDIISWFASKRKKYLFSYSPALKWVRYGTLVVFIVACIAGIGSLVALISPIALMGVSLLIYLRQSIKRATICWPISRNVWIVTHSIRCTYGCVVWLRWESLF